MAYTVTARSPEEVQKERDAFNTLLRTLGPASPAEVARALDERREVPPDPDLDPDLVVRLRYRINQAAEDSAYKAE